jgi:hypothetical protein
MKQNKVLAMVLAMGACFSGEIPAVLPQASPPPAPPAQEKPAKPPPEKASQVSPAKPKPPRSRIKPPSSATPRRHLVHHTPKSPKKSCEERGGKESAHGLCEFPYTEEECDKLGGALDSEGVCHVEASDCESMGAVENDEGQCVTKSGKSPKKPHGKQTECEVNEAHNDEGRCVAVTLTPEECTEQDGYFDEQSGCVFKKGCERQGGKWDEQKDSCEM